MARKINRRKDKGSAWYKRSDNAWYYTPAGMPRQRLKDEAGNSIKGENNGDAAARALARIKAGIAVADQLPTGVLVADVCNLYLTKKKMGCDTLKLATKLLNNLCEHCGAVQAEKCTPDILAGWVAKHSWADTTEHNTIKLVQTAFNFAIKRKLIATNPINDYEKPPTVARIVAFSDAEIKAIVAATSKPFASFFTACLETGARPFSELAKVTADNIHEENGNLVIVIKAGRDSEGNYRHKTAGKTGKDRVIMLTAEMQKEVRQLMLTAPCGSGLPLWRNASGEHWTAGNVGNIYRRAAKKVRCVGKPFYATRHTYGKRLVSGYYGQPVGLYVVAKLMGITHTVAERHYAAWSKEYSQPLFAALGLTQKPDVIALPTVA